VAAVELLEQLDVRRYKIASGEIGNFLMLEHIARSGKDIWISSGMSSYEEIGSVLNFLDKREASKKRVLFQCTTAYPTTADRIGLNVLSEFKSRFDLPVGLSDHSGAIYPPLAAIPLGAEYLECHIVFDKAMFGPDSRASLSVAEFRQMVEGVRFIEQAMANPVDKNEVEQYAELKTMFGKSIALSVGLSEGDSLTFEVLESKKPAGQGIPAESYAQVLGKKVKRKIAAGEFLNWEDLD
jgi:N-acetylneuraminate synthase